MGRYDVCREEYSLADGAYNHYNMKNNSSLMLD